MRTLFTILTILIFSFRLVAQSPVLWGKPADIDKKTPLETLAFTDNEGTVLWRYRATAFGNLHIATLEAYSPDMNRIAQVSPPEEYGGEKVFCLSVFRLKETPYMLMAGKMGEHIGLTAWALDRKTLLPKGEPIPLFDTGMEYSKRDMNLYLLPEFDCVFNSDTSEMVLTFWNYGGEKLQVFAYGPSMKSLWNTQISFNPAVTMTSFGSPMLSFRDGKMAIVTKRRMSKQEEKQLGKDLSRFGVFTYNLTLISEAGKKVQQIPIKLDDASLIKSIALVWQDNGSIRCIGSYTSENKTMGSQIQTANMGSRGSPDTRTSIYVSTGRAKDLRIETKEAWAYEAVPIAGTYSVVITPEGNIDGEPVRTPLMPLLLKNKTLLKAASKLNYEENEELHGFEPVRIVTCADGTLVALYESKMPMNKLRSNDRFCSDILAIGLRSDGEAVWATIVPKYQNVDQWKFAANVSFGLVQQDNLLHFIYLNDGKADAALWLCTLNSKGETIASKKLVGPSAATPPMPRYGIQTGKMTFLLPAGHEDKFRLGTLKL